ncbi:unnamed protein product [Fusarium equiseti]|uniref:Uncharacterized protein n=1 Tax=Fusarium equiseti TaxID=61235 RepID=A0A8J2IMN6_FUSEQ|nr:unnamed protein product [Fusarium equiseti]
MPALAKPSSWASVAKEFPALVARQLKDNKPSTTTLLSFNSGNVWYKNEAFWIIAGIVGAIVVCGGIGLCALSSSEMRLAEPPSLMARMEADQAENAEKEEKNRRRIKENAEKRAKNADFRREWDNENEMFTYKKAQEEKLKHYKRMGHVRPTMTLKEFEEALKKRGRELNAEAQAI